MKKLATERQKQKLKELDIDFDEDITMLEAAEIIRSTLPPYEEKLEISDTCLVEFSEIDLSEL